MGVGRMERQADEAILHATVAGTIEDVVEQMSTGVARNLVNQLRSSGIMFHRVGHVHSRDRVNVRHGRRLLEAARTAWLFGGGPLTLQRPPGYDNDVGPIETTQEVQVARDVDPEMAALICWAVNNLPALLDRYEAATP